MKLGTDKSSDKAEKKVAKKEAAPKKEAKKEAKKEVVKAAPPMTAFTDALIFKGGSFKEICEAAQVEGSSRGLKQVYTVGYFNAHIAYRMLQNKEWLNDHNLTLTKEGITKNKSK